MKKSFFEVVFICLFLAGIFYYKSDIANFIMKKTIKFQSVELPSSSGYNKDFEFDFVKHTDDFIIKNKEQFLDVIYTMLDNGTNDFTIYCSEDYDFCMNDFNMISSDATLLSTINNMVSPYNSYEKIYFKTTTYGKINISIDKQYTENEISLIENKIKEFEAAANENASLTDKIKAFHDFLINNSTYDKVRAAAIESGNDSGTSNSHKASGPLIDGIALCSGYSDAMKIYLDKLNVPNYKISNAKHIWNLVYLDGKWYHLDLTWDDPVTNTGEQVLLHKFFLIDTPTLFSIDPSGHSFNVEYYKEAS